MVTQPLFPFARDLFVVDLFAGGGGASEGIRRALGRCPDVAINHDEHSIKMHAKNHPDTRHYQEDVFAVDPVKACGGRRPDLLWMSPDCRHFSRAKGAKPVSAKIRSLAGVGIKWARRVRPRVLCLENVDEFKTWGPLHPPTHPDPKKRGRPIKARAGDFFLAWVRAMEALGYVVEWRTLVCADFGAPTTRKRLFLIARLGAAPVWPEPTHGPGRAPYRTAAECIDWSIPVPSIFTLAHPYADATCRRIAAGVVRYLLEDPEPYIVELPGGERVSPSLIQTGYGERKGQAPRVLDLHQPLGTVVAGGQKHGLVFAWIAKHYGGVVGIPPTVPLSTVTATDHHALVAGSLEPAPGRSRQVAAFLTTYYGTRSVGQRLGEPLRTVTTRDRFGLVYVDIGGEQHLLTDIGMRMLQPRELARAHGFGEDYVLEGTKRAQVARIGNSVPVAPVEAIVRANVETLRRESATPGTAGSGGGGDAP